MKRFWCCVEAVSLSGSHEMLNRFWRGGHGCIVKQCETLLKQLWYGAEAGCFEAISKRLWSFKVMLVKSYCCILFDKDTV